MNIWDDKELLDKLEAQRALIKIGGKRLTFDCLKLKCRDNRAYCSKGLILGQAKDGSMDLLSVLRGMTSGSCRNCPNFITEEEVT